MNELFLALCSMLAWQQEGWERALAEGDYSGAWRAAVELPEPQHRARAQAQILYTGGDPAGALECAEAGLRAAPGELELLFYATGSALWLGEPVRAQRLGADLAAALAGASLAAEPRIAWARTVEDFRARGATLAANEEARDRAVRLSRAVSIAGLVAALAGLLFLARQGRSSKPVS